jgi:hypothetical protein
LIGGPIADFRLTAPVAVTGYAIPLSVPSNLSTGFVMRPSCSRYYTSSVSEQILLIDDFMVFALTLLLVVLSLPTILQIARILKEDRQGVGRSPSTAQTLNPPTLAADRFTVETQMAR